jgi:hypothetical protein
MEKALRHTLRNIVTQCRKLLEEAVGELLQGQFGIHADGKVEDAARLSHLTPADLQYRGEVLAHLEHIKASGLKPKDAAEQLIREAAFTHLNRLCAYKMMTSRGLSEDPVGKGLKSRGFLFYLADHPDDEALYNGAEQDVAYRHYFEWLNESLSSEIGVLFAREDLATRLFPPFKILTRVLDLINSADLQPVWSLDETIGWIFQYFTPKELRDKARKLSAAPRNSNEMAFRNQFFTPRYVVEFLVDNTLGRTWYEMRDGDTTLKDKCRYLAIQSKDEAHSEPGLTKREKKDPRQIKVLDPASGSGHFLLYCFDLFQTIYEEAYADTELGPTLQLEFPDGEGFRRAIPGLILAHNLHGIDIDLRVTQLSALALWLRAQRAFQEMGLKDSRPQIRRMKLVCAEPMPGEEDLLEEFIAGLKPHALGELTGGLLRGVFERMKLAGEAGALVRIEDDISGPIEEARRQWQEMVRQKAEGEEDLAKKGALFDYRKEEAQQKLLFDIADITSEKVWRDAEAEVIQSLHDYARSVGNGKGLSRKLFAEDAEQGFAFIDLCRQKFDVVLMNPPFGDASLPSKSYIDETYGDTKGDVYKAFVECFQDRLVPGGFLGIISSRTGFFLSGSSDWRERIVLRLYRPLVLADFGMGVLDAMVETAAYVLRSLTAEEDRQLTLHLAKELKQVPTDKKDIFSTKRYEDTRDLKRHQANRELRRLYEAGFIKSVEGRFPRWLPLEGEIERAPEPANAPYPPLVCLRLLNEADKGGGLNEALHIAHDPRRFVAAPEVFKQLPNTPFAYWVSLEVRQVFRKFPKFESGTRSVRLGLSTKNDARFVRMAWEVIPAEIGRDKRWATYANGGEFSRFYHSYTAVVLSENNFSELSSYLLAKFPYLGGNAGWILHLENDYLRPCIGWPLRTHSFSPHFLPAEAVFSARTYAAYEQLNLLATTLSILASQITDYLLKVSLGRFNHPEFVTNVVRTLPIPPSVEERNELSNLSIASFQIKQTLDGATEISRIFYLPALLQVNGDTLVVRVTAWQTQVAEAEQQLAAFQLEIEDIAYQLYGINHADRRAIESSIVERSSPNTDGEHPEADDEAEDERLSTDQRQLTADFISYAVGCALGRWDARFATGERPVRELPDPFAPLPVCAPGALTGEDGLPLGEVPEGYPLRVDSDGILVEDSTHTDDLVTRVGEVFQLLWLGAAEAREREACELLGVKDLREYFRKPAAGGFWTDHVKRYSKSRRKAPIYWLLRSSKGNYSIWLYYHRLDKDILYKALLNYVEPKIRLEENNLAQLRSQREVVGTAGREAKLVEKQFDKQETFVSELFDFRDKLERAAELHLEPDLDDGVVLNIAPLWELVPWSEAKKYWNELLEGKYEWSSIGKQLRERNLVKA